ncbi:MAG: hypothetical protein FWB72_02460 [Firmicutes bacterium]|nr:hypothetical protein [Bacillota bacterium]
MEKGPSSFGQYWTSDESEWRHFLEHGHEFNAKTVEEYTAKAVRFANSQGRNIRAFRAKDGSIYKYIPRTNEFMIISETGKIVTYFKPTRGQKYFEEQFIKYGVYWIS